MAMNATRLLPSDVSAVRRQSETTRGPKREHVDTCLICPLVPWTSEGGFENVRLLDPAVPPMLLQLIVMSGIEHRAREPEGFVHGASLPRELA